MMRAAIANGADAVYFGVQQFNARLRAANFDTTDLPRIVRWLHENGVRAYIVLNTLVFTEELDLLTETLVACSDAGVDAVLVQDLGVARLANAIAPGLPVHASTQMTATCAESIAALETLGVSVERVVVARELSRKDLRKIIAETHKEIEVFVHGAICVAYSGQCLTSEALGGRSANRGECAQACRLPYDLVVDGETREVEGLKYLLSPKDLAAYEDIGDLMEMGIASLKIEGRLKSPNYVAATVQSYRAAVEQVLAGEAPLMDDATREKLEMTFSRGFTGGYLHETNHQAVVEGSFPKKRGLLVGRVTRVARGGVYIDAISPLRAGDGVVFDDGHPERTEEGGRVYTIDLEARPVIPVKEYHPTEHGPRSIYLRFGEGKINWDRVAPGQKVWKTSDPALDRALEASWQGDLTHRRPIDAVVRGAVGEPLRLTLLEADGAAVTVLDSAPADEALKHPLAEPVLRDQLGRLGGTPFELRNLTIELAGNLMVPKSRLNDLRRRAVEQLLEARRLRGTSRPIHREAATALRAPVTAAADHPPVSTSELTALCRTLPQVEAAVESGLVRTIYTDFEDIRLHREARPLIPDAIRFVPATLRVVKPGEAPFVRKLIEAQPDAILVRNLASWTILRELAPELPLLGDYSLNVSNPLTAALLMRHGLERLVPSYDLNIEQLLALLQGTPSEWFEVTLHQYMPMFHMEHCVFCRYLSSGTDFTNCGRPCEKHTVALRDRMGYEHHLKADAGCRNTVFNATAQSGCAYLPQLLTAGVRRFRVDFVTEDPATVRQVLGAYAPAIRAERDGTDLWRELRATSKLGVTKGSLDHA
jgi:putative protease